MPTTSVMIPESLGELLEPFRYLGHLGKDETQAAKAIRSGKVQYKPRIILEYDAELAFYTTDESLEAMSDIGDCMIHAVLLYDRSQDPKVMPTTAQYKRIWKSGFRLAISYLRAKGIEAHWNYRALSPLWVSAYTNVENIYYTKGKASTLLLDATEEHAKISGCSPEQVHLHKELISKYAEGNLPEFLPDTKIANYFGVAGIYDLCSNDLRSIIQAIDSGKVHL